MDSYQHVLESDQNRADSGAQLAHNPSTPTTLGRLLIAARAVSGTTQVDLAAVASCSVRALWQAERGQGSTATFSQLADALGMEIDGRSLPPGEHLGARLLALRLRTKTSRASLAAACGISRTTIAAIEAGRPGHLAALERMGEALGARLTLARRGQPAAFYASVATSSAWDAWASPQDILDRLYVALGDGFDLDPCSPGRGRCRVKARRHLTEDDDGLSLPWHGRAFMNPPYGRDIAAWTAKARAEVETGRCTLVIGLIPARTDTSWWHRDVADRGDIWMLKGRLSFGAGDQAAPFPSAIVAWGLEDGDRQAMRAAFADAWHLAPPSRPRIP